MQYSELVASLKKPDVEIRYSLVEGDGDVLHMLLGLAGEVGELVDALKKAIFYRKELDRTNVVEELGDIEFYLEGLRQCLNITRGEALEANMAKLLTRYSAGSYSDAQAQDRADKES